MPEYAFDQVFPTHIPFVPSNYCALFRSELLYAQQASIIFMSGKLAGQSDRYVLAVFHTALLCVMGMCWGIILMNNGY